MPDSWESTKADCVKNEATFKARIDECLGGNVTVVVDYDSYQNCTNPDRVWYRLSSWSGYYIFNEIAYAIERAVSRYEAKDILCAGIQTIKFMHENAGRPKEQCVFMEGTTLVCAGSHCCWSHQFSDWSAFEFLGRHFELVINYYIKEIQTTAIDEATKTMADEFQGWAVPFEVDITTFDYNDLTGDERRDRREKTLERAANWRGYYPIRTCADIMTYITRYNEGTLDEVKAAFKKVVFKNVPNTGDSYEARDKKSIKYDIDNRVLTLNSAFETYWGYVDYWEIRELTTQIIKIMRMGIFHDMTIEQHDKKIELLKEVCNSWDTYYGRFDHLKQVLRYPCFYPKTNHERQCFKVLLDHINSATYREKNVPEDVLEAEELNLMNRGADPATFKETFIGGWFVHKINWKGMIQDRLVFVTDRATYVAKPIWGKKKADSKEIHRYAHEHTVRIEMGEFKWKNTGGISGSPNLPGMPNLGLPGIDLPNVPKVDLPNVDLPNAPNIDLPNMPNLGLSLKDFKGPPWALRVETNRKRGEECKKSGFKLPEIPDLKENLFKLLDAMVEKIKSVEFPDFKPPGLPTFKVPDLLGLMGKAKPSIPNAPAVPTGGTEQSPYACDATVPKDPPGIDKFNDLSGEVGKMDNPPAIDKIPGMPDNLVGSMLSGFVNFAKGLGDLVLDLPAEFTLQGMLKMIGKKVAKLAGKLGIGFPKIPSFSFAGALDLIAETCKVDSITKICGEMKAGAAAMSPIEFTFPDLNPMRLLNAIMEQLNKVTLPEMPNITEYLPGLPSLPGMPDIPLPGMPANPLGTLKISGPKKSEMMMAVLKPILPSDMNEGISKWVCLEIGHVMYAGMRAYWRSCSSPWEGYTIEAETTSMSNLYNKTGRGKVKPPSGDGEDLAEPL